MGLGDDHADVQRELDALRIEVEELRASRMRLALAADAEHRGIERALHGGVQQLLVAIATDLELAIASVDADPAAARERFADLRRDVQQTIQEARDLAERISPPLLEAGGLGVAVRAAAATRGVPVRVHVPTGAGYPPRIASLVYACCLDVLEQVGTGTAVTCTVRDDEDAVTFEIVAARVVDPGTVVRDRVEALGGQLTILQGDHRTTVTGSLPLAG